MSNLDEGSVPANGHRETKLQLETPVPGNEGNVQMEWAYGLYNDISKPIWPVIIDSEGPYLNHYKFAAGIQVSYGSCLAS